MKRFPYVIVLEGRGILDAMRIRIRLEMESGEIFVAEFAFTTEGENYRGKRTISSFGLSFLVDAWRRFFTEGGGKRLV